LLQNTGEGKVRQTSLLAYSELKQAELTRTYKQILEALRYYGAMTDREICNVLNYKDPNKVRPRRNELVKMGEIEEKGKRICSISGKKAIMWGVLSVKGYQNVTDKGGECIGKRKVYARI